MADKKVPCPFCERMADPEKVPGPGDIICVQCGMNLLTGLKVDRGQPARSSAKIPWFGILAALVTVLVVALVAGGVYWIVLRDPVERAREAGRGGNVLDGIEILEAHIAKVPEDAEAHLVMGQLYWQGSEFARAAAEFSIASRLAPQDEDAALLTVVASEKGKTVDYTNTQIAALQRLVQEQPRNARALYLLGLALGTIGDHVGQASALERALALGTDDVPEESLRAQLAVAQALLGQTAAAEEQSQKALAQNPNDGDVQALQGFLASLRGENSIATAALEQAVRESTSVGELAKGRLGLARLEEGRFDEALALLREAKNAPGAPPATEFYHALALQLNGLNEEAVAAFDQIANTPGKFSGDAAMQLGQIYLDQNKIDPASEALRRAQSNGESSARLYTLLGRMEMLQGNVGEAQNSFRQALQLDRDYAPAHLENGLAFVSRGSLIEGVQELRRYLELVSPENPGSRYPEIELLVNQLSEASDQAPVIEAAR